MGEIQIPTLVVVGESDMPTPRPCAETMAEEIPNAQLLVIPESGHLTILEATDIVASAIDEHLTMHRERI
ncbi:MAG TPA: alpha/beta hydrolase [Myxococcales bacterium]|nr:alpha/beta hydrolase [Myxococcales bacterium]